MTARRCNCLKMLYGGGEARRNSRAVSLFGSQGLAHWHAMTPPPIFRYVPDIEIFGLVARSRCWSLGAGALLKSDGAPGESLVSARNNKAATAIRLRNGGTEHRTRKSTSQAPEQPECVRVGWTKESWPRPSLGSPAGWLGYAEGPEVEGCSSREETTRRDFPARKGQWRQWRQV